ncbi:HAMP domain-containing sensor histidine kinase [Arthrobacter sp. UYEF20]|uniref:sensor histidine kinase n=1 Tax=Arthrobacter sp. UYEF20 TaxID=1756363 RepID=UPI0033990CA9
MQEQSDLEREALNAALVVDPAFSGRDMPEIPSAAPETELGLYNTAGQLVAGAGPARADAATAPALGLPAGHDSQEWLVAVVPVAAGEKTTGALRAASPAARVWQRVGIGWAALLAAGLLAVAVAWLLARKLARQISRPMEQLAEASVRLGHGEFDLQLPHTGVLEVDRAGSALNAAAASLGELVTREQRLAANVSHQLRTPLTGLRATLEHALSDPTADLRAAARQAIGSADKLESTIADVMTLTRGPVPASPEVDLAALVDGIASLWHGPLAARARPLRVSLAEDVAPLAVAPRAVEQILDVLLDNALQHGSGTVRLEVRALERAVAIDVADSGGNAPDEDIFLRGTSGDGGTGVGLALARQMAEDLGGRLLLSRRSPETQFTLLLPRQKAPDAP